MVNLIPDAIYIYIIICNQNYLLITLILNKPELICLHTVSSIVIYCLHTVKWLQVLQFNSNDSIEHKY